VSRILWHGIGPGHATGYGKQTREFTGRLRDLGHEVVIAMMGEQGARSPLNHPSHAGIRDTGRWDGMAVIPPGPREFGLPARGLIREAFAGHDPDLIIVLKDAWVLRPADYRGYNTAVWLAFDTEPLGVADREFFRASGARAVCVSLAGRRMARDAGARHRIDGLRTALYVPSGIDADMWTPGDRGAARALLGLPADAFIAGICAANIGPRKAWGEQFAAFAAFRRNHPDALLLVHAAPEHPEGINLRELAAFHGLQQAVLFGEHTAMDDAQMRSWYRSLNVLLAATYGEGYGLPVEEAHACGIPVIGTRCSALTEHIPQGTGWLIDGQRWWNPHHQAEWTIPSIKGIAAALEKAREGRHARPELIREHAMRYDCDRVAKTDWPPVLDELLKG